MENKEEKQTEKTFKLTFTEKELKNPNIRKAMTDLVIMRAQLKSSQPFFEVDEAEAEILPWASLFTPIKDYGEGKYPDEIGKLKSQRIIKKK